MRRRCPFRPFQRLLCRARIYFVSFRTNDGQLASNADVADGGGLQKVALRTRFAQQSVAGHSLHCGRNAPPAASQDSVPGVAIETQLCSNDANVSGRTAAPTYST